MLENLVSEIKPLSPLGYTTSHKHLKYLFIDILIDYRKNAKELEQESRIFITEHISNSSFELKNTLFLFFQKNFSS